MKPSERRKQMKEEMASRVQESYNSKDGSGKYKSIFVKDAVGNVPFWKCSEDEHFINIIPYIAGSQNPNVKEGKLAYNLDIQVHRKVGVNEDSYICLARTFGRKCPICEEQTELRKQDDYDEKYVKSLNPTRRVIYNIEVLDSDKEQKKGIQLFEVSHWLFEKELAELAKKPKGGGFVLFSDPDDGKTVFFRKKGNGPTNTEYKAFKFEDRTEPISDDILDAALCLDELIHIPTYEEVKNAFYGTESEASEEEIHERHVEADEGGRRSRGREETPKFKCPGVRPDDFGDLDACEDCPNVAECESEFNAQEEAEAAKASEAAEKERTKEEEPVRRTARRSEPEPEPESKNESSEPSEGRRVRRRPGA